VVVRATAAHQCLCCQNDRTSECKIFPLDICLCHTFPQHPDALQQYQLLLNIATIVFTGLTILVFQRVYLMHISSFIWVNCCWLFLYSAILHAWADSLRSCCMLFWSAVNINPIGVCTVVFGCCIAGAMWCCCHLGTCSVCTIQICTSLQCYFMKSHILECMCV